MYHTHPEMPESESYVVSPPACQVFDRHGNIFTLGFDVQGLHDSPHGHYAFNIIVNGNDTGIYASHIERRNGKIRILQRNGIWKYWNGHSFN